MTKEMIAACLMAAANHYDVPPAVMVGIMHVEGGRVGQEVANKNGSYDLGPMQINTIWLPQLAGLWKKDVASARMAVRDNACVNVYVAAWILRQTYQRTGTLWGAIAHYHSATPWRGEAYAQKVVTAMHRYGLIKDDSALKPQKLAQR
ncbi:MAG: transglycosylase [Alphaproteobacteria bacterium]|nr:transglycosylase [Alphaproteobacteria bacterium]